MKSKILIPIILIILIGFLGWYFYSTCDAEVEGVAEEVVIPLDYYIEQVEVVEDSTYGKLMEEVGIDGSIYLSIFEAAEDIYDLSSVRLGRTFDLYYKKDTNNLYQLVYQIDSEDELFVTASSTEEGIVWQAEKIAIPYETKIKTVEGIVETSMYESAMAQGIDERAVVGFANAMQWSVDFAWEVQKGDSYKFIYEERYRDGKYIMPGQILAGKFVNVDKPIYAFYFEESEENKTFFDENGNSVQKMFLKAPLDFVYITSGFTTGSRYISAFNISTGHRAIDYAASIGTPIRVTADGVVTYTGWNSGGYGYLTKIRHNSTYSTNYAHQSKIAVRVGQRVSQGQTIGYVGSTGLSTGPHLHYEMVKNGVKINPLQEILPPGEPIKEENMGRFYEIINPLKEQLDN